jgi:hypothetical protein
MTGLAGLPVYLELLHAMGLSELIERHLQVKQRGWTDAQLVLSLMLLNIAGGDCVEDLGKVQKDEGFCRVLRRVEQQGMKRWERREVERRWRKERWRSVQKIYPIEFICLFKRGAVYHQGKSRPGHPQYHPWWFSEGIIYHFPKRLHNSKNQRN